MISALIFPSINQEATENLAALFESLKPLNQLLHRERLPFGGET